MPTSLLTNSASPWTVPPSSATGTLSAKDTTWVPLVNWQIASRSLMKNHLMVLDLLANNNWKRPIYFAVTTGPDSYINLQNTSNWKASPTGWCLCLHGEPQNPNLHGRVATDVMYDNVMNKFKWGNMDTEGTSTWTRTSCA
jgi:hypothetical protein